MLVMAWGLHWATSAPGAQDDATWVRGVADYVATMPLKHKFVYGTNLYAMDWPAGGGPAHKATAYEYGDIVPRLPAARREHRARPGRRQPPRDLHRRGRRRPRRLVPGRDDDRPPHPPRAPTAASAAVGFWRLGLEDQRVWDDPLLAPGAPW